MNHYSDINHYIDIIPYELLALTIDYITHYVAVDLYNH